MSMLITWTLGALAWVPAQDEGRAAAVRAQLEKDVQGKAPAAQAPAQLQGAAGQEDPILALLLQLEQDPSTPAMNARTKLRQLGSAVRPILPRYLGQLSPIALRGTLQFLLEEAPDAEAIAALERLMGGADPVARVVVARCLDEVRGPARAGLIDRALASADARVRYEALRALGRVEQMDPRLATAVGELARSENSEERRLAAELCGSIALRERSEVGAIIDALVADAELEVRRMAIEAWLERSAKATEADALAFRERLAGEVERQVFLRSVYSRERPWPQLYDRDREILARWNQHEIQQVVRRHSKSLDPETLVACAAASSQASNDVFAELDRRASPVGVDLALSEFESAPNRSNLFEYVRKLAPERLVPLGKRLIANHWTWAFYESRADADTVRAALDFMRSYRQGHDARGLQRIVRDRSDASCFEALLEAVPPREPNDSDAPWTGAVRAALVRLAGPEQLAIVLQRCTEIDAETLQNLLDALRPHWKPEHAPLLVAAGERYIASRSLLHSGLGDVLATRVGPPGRAALLRFVEAATESAAFGAWRALIRSAAAEEQRALLLRSLAPSTPPKLAEEALETYAAVIAADAELCSLATPWFARGLATDVLTDGWPRLVPPEMRSAEVRKLVAALRSSKRDDVREAAVLMLGYLRGPEVVAEIAPFLDDPATKNNAIQALQQTGERDAVPLIIECLRDPSEEARALAKQALEALELYFQAKERWEKR
ncbi:MAG: HEAT repeat domain-containing protein [Planctomycetes bacterium]|nr:HEAT repeat domain-containing protein [Planctomycetota bacterium]